MNKHDLYTTASALFVQLHQFIEVLQKDLAQDVNISHELSHAAALLTDTVQEPSVREIVVSLLGRNGEVPPTSRLNMGHSQHYHNHQASILIHSSTWEFFPEPQFPFDVHTDDDQTLRMKVTGTVSRSLVTFPNYRTLSEYIRGRLGMPIENQITRETLENYGRTDITFRKKNDQFFLDFRSKKNVWATGQICEHEGIYETLNDRADTRMYHIGDSFLPCPLDKHPVLWNLRAVKEEHLIPIESHEDF